jgi:hypothetical protein
MKSIADYYHQLVTRRVANVFGDAKMTDTQRIMFGPVGPAHDNAGESAAIRARAQCDRACLAAPA